METISGIWGSMVLMPVLFLHFVNVYISCTIKSRSQLASPIRTRISVGHLIRKIKANEGGLEALITSQSFFAVRGQSKASLSKTICLTSL
jgi:hypothetical protein